jgi:hypothetical protein
VVPVTTLLLYWVNPFYVDPRLDPRRRHHGLLLETAHEQFRCGRLSHSSLSEPVDRHWCCRALVVDVQVETNIAAADETIGDLYRRGDIGTKDQHSGSAFIGPIGPTKLIIQSTYYALPSVVIRFVLGWMLKRCILKVRPNDKNQTASCGLLIEQRRDHSRLR